MPTPDPNTLSTLRLISKLSPQSTPVRIQINPPPWAQELDCVDIVQRLVAESGGKMILGWALWEWPGVIVEGEFHAVWEKPDGELTDPTPRKDHDESVLFLPDPNAVIDIYRKDNVRLPLANRREILDFIEIKERIHRTISNSGGATSKYYTRTPHLDYLLTEEKRIFRRLVARFGAPPEL